MKKIKDFLYNVKIDFKADTKAIKASINEINKSLNSAKGRLKENLLSRLGIESDTVSDLKNVGNIAKSTFSSLSGGMKLLVGAGGAAVAAITGIVVASKALYDANVKLNKELKQLKGFFKNVPTESLIVAKNRIEALAETTNTSTEEITSSVANLAKAYKIDLASAINIYEKAAIQGGNASGELAAQFEEFSNSAKEAGLSADAFGQLLADAPSLGVYKDRLGDLINEINAVGLDFNKVKEDLTKPFGAKFADDITKGLKEGSISAVEVVGLVNDEAERLNLTGVELKSVYASLYGTLAEETPMEVWEAIEKASGGYVRNLTEAEKAQQKLVESQIAVKTALDEAVLNLNREGGFLDSLRKFKNEKLLEDAETINYIADITNKNIKGGKGVSAPRVQTRSPFLPATNTLAAITGPNKLERRFIRDDLKEYNAYRADLAKISFGIAQDRIDAKLRAMEINKSIDETELENLRARQKEESELTSKKYQSEIAEAQLAADEIYKTNTGRLLNEKMTKAQYEEEYRRIKSIAEREGNDESIQLAREQLATINDARARVAQLELERQNELAAIKKRYDKEELERVKALLDQTNEIVELRNEKEIKRLKIQIKQTDNLEDQLTLSKEIYDTEKKAVDLEREKLALRLAEKKGTTTGTGVADELKALKERQMALERIDKAAKATLEAQRKLNEVRGTPAEAAAIKARGTGVTAFGSYGDVPIKTTPTGAAGELDTALLAAGFPSIDYRTKEGTKLEFMKLIRDQTAFVAGEIAKLAAKSKKLTDEYVSDALSGSMGEEAKKDAERVAEKTNFILTQKAIEQADTELQIIMDYNRKKLSLLEAFIEASQAIEEASFEKNQRKFEDRVKRLWSQLGSQLGDFQIKNAFQTIEDLWNADYIRRRLIATETKKELQLQLDLRKQQIELEARNKVTQSKVGAITINTTGLTPEQIDEAYQKEVEIAKKRFDEIKDLEIRSRRDAMEANIRLYAKGFKDLSEEEIDILVRLNTQKLQLNEEYIAKLDEVNTALEDKLDSLSQKFEKLAEAGRAITDVISSVFELMNQATQTEIDRLGGLIDNLTQKIQYINDLISQSETRVSDLESKVEDSRGKRKADLLKLYESERDRLIELREQELQYNKEKVQYEANQSKLAEKIQKRERALMTLNSLVTTSEMIAASAKAIKASQSAPFPANLIAITTSMGALISAFATAKSAFKFEKGGSIDGGLLKGPRHSTGGIPIEAEGGEYIFSRKAVNRIGKSNLDRMNFGSSTPKFELGGLINSNTQTEQLDTRFYDYFDKLINRPNYVTVTDIKSGFKDDSVRMESNRF